MLIDTFFRNMVTKYRFNSELEILTGSGLPLPYATSPSVSTKRTFVNAFMDNLFVVANPCESHRCNDLCHKEVQVVLAKDGHLAIDLVPRYVFA